MGRLTNTLQELDLGGNHLEDNDLDMLVVAIKKTEGVKRIPVGGYDIRGGAVVSLAMLLESNESIVEELDLSNNSIGVQNAQILINSLESNSKLNVVKSDR